MNVDDANANIVNGEVKEKLAELSRKCAVYTSEVQLIMEFVNIAISEKDETSARAELTDFSKIEGQFTEVYGELMCLAMKEEINHDNYQKMRKDFALLCTTLKAKVNKTFCADRLSVSSTHSIAYETSANRL